MSRVVFFDGAARGSFGPAGYAWVLVEGGVEVAHGSGHLPEATNNQAEWMGAIEGVRAARARGWHSFVLRGDSQVVCRQILGQYEVLDPKLQQLRSEFVSLASGLKLYVSWIPRADNERANELAQAARDGQVSSWEMPAQDPAVVHAADPVQSSSGGTSEGDTKEEGGRMKMDLEMVVPGNTGVTVVGYGYLVTGKLAEAIAQEAVVRITIVSSESNQTWLGWDFDTRLVKVEQHALEGSAVLVSAEGDNPASALLDFLSAVNVDRARSSGYASSVRPEAAWRRFIEDLISMVDRQRRERRRAETVMIGGIGSVLPGLTMRQDEEGRYYIGVGDRILADLAVKAGIGKGLTRFKRALLIAHCVNTHGVVGVLFRNPVTEGTNSFVPVRILVVPSQRALFLPPDLAKKFYGDFDGDMYFVAFDMERLVPVAEEVVASGEEVQYSGNVMSCKLGKRSAIHADDRLQLERLGVSLEPASRYQGLSALIGAHAKVATGALHASFVTIIDIAAAIGGDECSNAVADKLLPLMEVIMDASKETSKIGRSAHGLPFAQHLVNMMQLYKVDQFVAALRQLADMVDDYFGNAEAGWGRSIREAAALLEEAAARKADEIRRLRNVDIEKKVYGEPGMMLLLEGPALNSVVPDPVAISQMLQGLRRAGRYYRLANRGSVGKGAAAPKALDPVKDANQVAVLREEIYSNMMPRLPARWSVTGGAYKVVARLVSEEVTTIDPAGNAQTVLMDGVSGSRFEFVDISRLREAGSGVVELKVLDVTSKLLGKEEVAISPNKHGQYPAFIVIRTTDAEQRHRLVVLAPVANRPKERWVNNAYRVVAATPVYRVASMIGNHVLAISVGERGEYVVSGRFVLGRSGSSGGWAIVMQTPEVVLLETLLRAVIDSRGVKIGEDGTTLDSIWLQRVPTVARSVGRVLEELLGDKVDEAGRVFLAQRLTVDEGLLDLICQKQVVTKKEKDSSGRSVSYRLELPFDDSLSFLTLGDAIQQVLSADGVTRRGYLPFKDSAARFMWFDPSDPSSLRALGIGTAMTNNRRVAREQLPTRLIEPMQAGSLSDGLEIDGTHVVMNVLFGLANWVNTSSGESVEGGHLLHLEGVNLRVTRSTQVKLDLVAGNLGEQVIEHLRTLGMRVDEVLIGEEWKPFDVSAIRAAQTVEDLMNLGLEVVQEDLGHGVIPTHVPMHVAYVGVPTTLKVHARECAIKGILTAGTGRVGSLLAKMTVNGNTVEVPVHAVMSSAAIVDKKTGTALIYGLCNLLRYLGVQTDIDRRMDEEILALRAELNEPLSDEGESKRLEVAVVAKYRDELLALLADTMPGVQVHRIPVIIRSDDGTEIPMGEGLVLRLGIGFLPYTSATIGSADYYGSQMLLRSFAMSKLAIARKTGGDVETALGAVRALHPHTWSGKVAHGLIERDVRSLYALLDLLSKLGLLEDV